MKATQTILNDITSFRDKVIEEYESFDLKMKAFYDNSVNFAMSNKIKIEYDILVNNVNSIDTYEDMIDIKLTQELANHIAQLYYENKWKFSIAKLEAIIKFYLTNDIINCDEITAGITSFEYAGIEHATSVFNHIFSNKNMLLHSITVLNIDNNKLIQLRCVEITKDYLDLTRLNTLEIEKIVDYQNIDTTKYGSKVPEFGNYSIDRMTKSINKAGYDTIIHNQNKYKEINND